MEIDLDEKISAAEFMEFYNSLGSDIWNDWAVRKYDDEDFYDEHFNKLTGMLVFEEPIPLKQLDGELINLGKARLASSSIATLFIQWRAERDSVKFVCSVADEFAAEFEHWCNSNPHIVRNVQLFRP